MPADLELMRGKIPFVSIAGSKGGYVPDLSYTNTRALKTYIWDSTNWTDGLNNNVNYIDRLENAYVDDVAQAGTWTVSVPVFAYGLVSLGALYVEWTGTGSFAVQYSINNGSSWTTITNQSSILEDAAAYTLTVDFRVTFTAGTAGALTQFKVLLVPNRLLNTARNITFKNTVFTDYAAISLPGSLSIAADAESTRPIGTIEAWIRLRGTTGTIFASATHRLSVESGVLTRNGSTSTVYVNGVAGSPTLAVNTWYHIVWVLAAPASNQMFVGVNTTGTATLALDIGYLATYATSLDAATVTALYSYNVGAPAVSIVDGGNIGVTESTPAVDAYAYVWSIVSADKS